MAVRARAAERQREATRQAIIDAAFAQVVADPSAAFSHESVARRADVAPRTVYRHFPTRSDLTTAVWQRLRDEHGTRWPSTEREILPALRRTFRQFAQLETLTRAAIAAAATTDYPVHGSAEGRAAFRRSLADLLTTLPARDGDRLVANCLAIYSAPYWQMLRDRGQLSARDAEDAAVAAMRGVLADARERAARARRRFR